MKGETLDSLDALEKWLTAHPGLIHYIFAVFGAGTAHALTLHKDYQGTVNFLRKLFPDRKDTFYFRVDAILSIIIGSIIGYVLTQPTSPNQALIAGLGWVSATNLAVRRLEQQVPTPPTQESQGGTHG